jgi:hypothetical protein
MPEHPPSCPMPPPPLTILARFLTVAAASRGVEEAVLDLVGPVWSKLGYVGGRLWFHDSAGGLLIPGVGWYAGRGPSPTPTPVMAGGPSLIGQCWARNQIEWVAWTSWDQGRPCPEVYTCVPLNAGGRVLGVLELATETADEPPTDLAALLGMLGGRLGDLAAAAE